MGKAAKSTGKPVAPDARLSIRVFIGADGRLGPGKVDLLESIAAHGSIRKGAAALKMSYRRAWLLVKATEEIFGAPLVTTAIGGHEGGGASLTAEGRAVVAAYRRLEGKALKVASEELATFNRLRKPSGR